MTVSDIPAAVELCRHAHWNQLSQDWQMFLALNPAGSVVAVSGGQVAGTVSTIRYGQAFSWVGMVLVDPAFKKRGIGTRLLGEALRILRNEATVKLDATPQGRELYLKLNFRDEYGLCRMVAEVAPAELPNENIIQITSDHIEKILAFDKAVFGADRSSLLKMLLAQGDRFAFCEIRDDVVAGYCFGRNGHRYTQIGPVVAENSTIAERVVTAAFSSCGGGSVVLDVTETHHGWLAWLGGKGFRKERSFVRMWLGQNNFAGNIEKQFAITGPEFG